MTASNELKENGEFASSPFLGCVGAPGVKRDVRNLTYGAADVFVESSATRLALTIVFLFAIYCFLIIAFRVELAELFRILLLLFLGFVVAVLVEKISRVRALVVTNHGVCMIKRNWGFRESRIAICREQIAGLFCEKRLIGTYPRYHENFFFMCRAKTVKLFALWCRQMFIN